MIDDDLGWQAPSTPSRSQQRGPRGRRRGGPQGSRAIPSGPASSTSADAFPSLAEAASATAAAPDPTYLRSASYMVLISYCSQDMFTVRMQGNVKLACWPQGQVTYGFSDSQFALLWQGSSLLASYMRQSSTTHVAAAQSPQLSCTKATHTSTPQLSVLWAYRYDKGLRAMADRFWCFCTWLATRQKDFRPASPSDSVHFLTLQCFFEGRAKKQLNPRIRPEGT